MSDADSRITKRKTRALSKARSVGGGAELRLTLATGSADGHRQAFEHSSLLSREEDIYQWSVSEVCEWVRSLENGRLIPYIRELKSQKINGYKLLTQLTSGPKLAAILKMREVEDRHILLTSIIRLNKQYTHRLKERRESLRMLDSTGGSRSARSGGGSFSARSSGERKRMKNSRLKGVPRSHIKRSVSMAMTKTSMSRHAPSAPSSGGRATKKMSVAEKKRMKVQNKLDRLFPKSESSNGGYTYVFSPYKTEYFGIEHIISVETMLESLKVPLKIERRIRKIQKYESLVNCQILGKKGVFIVLGLWSKPDESAAGDTGDRSTDFDDGSSMISGFSVISGVSSIFSNGMISDGTAVSSASGIEIDVCSVKSDEFDHKKSLSRTDLSSALSPETGMISPDKLLSPLASQSNSSESSDDVRFGEMKMMEGGSGVITPPASMKIRKDGSSKTIVSSASTPTTPVFRGSSARVASQSGGDLSPDDPDLPASSTSLSGSRISRRGVLRSSKQSSKKDLTSSRGSKKKGDEEEKSEESKTLSAAADVDDDDNKDEKLDDRDESELHSVESSPPRTKKKKPESPTKEATKHKKRRSSSRRSYASSESGRDVVRELFDSSRHSKSSSVIIKVPRREYIYYFYTTPVSKWTNADVFDWFEIAQNGRFKAMTLDLSVPVDESLSAGGSGAASPKDDAGDTAQDGGDASTVAAASSSSSSPSSSEVTTTISNGADLLKVTRAVLKSHFDIQSADERNLFMKEVNLLRKSAGVTAKEKSNPSKGSLRMKSSVPMFDRGFISKTPKVQRSRSAFTRSDFGSISFDDSSPSGLTHTTSDIGTGSRRSQTDEYYSEMLRKLPRKEGPRDVGRVTDYEFINYDLSKDRLINEDGFLDERFHHISKNPQFRRRQIRRPVKHKATVSEIGIVEGYKGFELDAKLTQDASKASGEAFEERLRRHRSQRSAPLLKKHASVADMSRNLDYKPPEWMQSTLDDMDRMDTFDERSLHQKKDSDYSDALRRMPSKLGPMQIGRFTDEEFKKPEWTKPVIDSLLNDGVDFLDEKYWYDATKVSKLESFGFWDQMLSKLSPLALIKFSKQPLPMGFRTKLHWVKELRRLAQAELDKLVEQGFVVLDDGTVQHKDDVQLISDHECSDDEDLVKQHRRKQSSITVSDASVMSVSPVSPSDVASSSLSEVIERDHREDALASAASASASAAARSSSDSDANSDTGSVVLHSDDEVASSSMIPVSKPKRVSIAVIDEDQKQSVLIGGSLERKSEENDSDDDEDRRLPPKRGHRRRVTFAGMDSDDDDSDDGKAAAAAIAGRSRRESLAAAPADSSGHRRRRTFSKADMDKMTDVIDLLTAELDKKY